MDRSGDSVSLEVYEAGGAAVQDSGEITVLLKEWREGSPAAADPLFELAYPQLRKIAGALFRGEKPGNLLQPTVVVSEVFLKLVQQRRLEYADRQHFYSMAARLMRRILVDHARSEGRLKRDGGTMVPLDDDMAWVHATTAEVVDLDRVLDELAALDAKKCQMLELRFFIGFSAEETAELMGCSKPTVDRDMRFVRAWIADRLKTKSGG